MFFVSGLLGGRRGVLAWQVWAVMLCGGLVWFAGMAYAKEPLPSARSPVTGVEIRRTTDGIPHLRAHSWRELGIGVGYVQAQDALCTLAEAFVTYEGRRSWFFGADGRPARDSTFGRPKNVDLDFFFRAFADDEVRANYRKEHPPSLSELIEGFAIGYNRYLADARNGRVSVEGRTCLGQPWVRDITVDDIHRRMYAAQIAAGYAKFVTEMANAEPAKSVEVSDSGEEALRRQLAHRIGTQPGIGSNVLAFGREATGGDGAVLFGNPHWYWGGPDRFYQMHLTIPGQVDVAGVTFLGVPVVMIGFNDHVAWSHTVSAARRLGLFDVTLDAADPTRYQVDGRIEAMTAREVTIDARAEDGSVRHLTRTFYRTRQGPVVDLGHFHTAFGWGSEHAMVMLDVNAENFRVFRNFFYWNQAKSLDDFIAIQRREAAVPWVNTVAIGRKDGRVWYGDVGAVPNVPDDLRKACLTPLAMGFVNLDPLIPVLDGSRSECDWRVDPAAVQAGAMPVAAMPWLLREDYVANMNDSYWLSNVHQPLEGFSAVLGGEGQPLSLRGRLGHHIALDLIRGRASSAKALSGRVMKEVLRPRAYSAELFKDEVLAQACAQTEIQVEAGTLKAAGLEVEGQAAAIARTVDIGRACAVLRRWSNQAGAGDRGTLLWEALWARLQPTPGADHYSVAFSREAPLDTPRKLRMEEGAAAKALAVTVVEFAAKGWPLDGALEADRFVESGGRRFPIYGGCDLAGYFTVACNDDGSNRMGPDSLANSFLQVVRFGPSGVEAYTLLAHGQDEAAVAGGQGEAPVARYARKAWLRFPFREDEIRRDPGLSRTVLAP